MEGDSLKLNFEIALEKIDTLTKQNNELLDTVDHLESELRKATSELVIEPLDINNLREKRFDTLNREADAAMERFTAKLNKELNKNAKSKQSKRQPV